MAVGMGYTNVSVYRQGIFGWAQSGHKLAATVEYPKIEVPLVRSSDLVQRSMVDNVLLDIRPAAHYRKGHIAGSINIDLEKLHRHLDRLPRNKNIVLIDHKGKLTLTTGRFLAANAFYDVERLDGGFNAWVKTGMPVEKY